MTLADDSLRRPTVAEAAVDAGKARRARALCIEAVAKRLLDALVLAIAVWFRDRTVV